MSTEHALAPRIIRRAAWSTRIEVHVPVGAPAAVEAEIERTLTDVDRAASRFRADSEVRAIAALPGDADGRARTRVSPLLADLLAAAQRAHALSDGLVDPCLGAEAIRAGYGSAPGRRTSAAAFRTGARWDAVRFEAASGVLDLPAGTLLDLGSSAKAHTADALAARLSELCEGAGVLVNLGGDIALAGECEEPWAIDVAGAVAGAPGGAIALRDGAVATSSTLLRTWRDAASGETRHHLLDPRTGRSARTPWAQASVVAGTCLDANTAASAALILGAQAPAMLAQAGLDARLVSATGDVLALGDWPAPAPAPSDLPALPELVGADR